MAKKAIRVKYQEKVGGKIELIPSPSPDTTAMSFIRNEINCTILNLHKTNNGYIWTDDEGLLVDGNIVAHYMLSNDPFDNPTLAGDIIISKGIGENDEVLWFDDIEDAEQIAIWITCLERSKCIGVTHS